jgi:hypothetical protein
MRDNCIEVPYELAKAVTGRAAPPFAELVATCKGGHQVNKCSTHLHVVISCLLSTVTSILVYALRLYV